MEQLLRLVGRESDLRDVARGLYGFAGELNAGVVGAMHVTCSDESERECVDAFQNGFAEPLLPSLKFGERSVFRIANLGGRYDTGAVRIAADHYSSPAASESFKLLVAKVNAHVCVEHTAGGVRFGTARRYDVESVYCGALHALLDGSTLPFARELRDLFGGGGLDRVAALLDEGRVAPALRSLFVAVVQARLQAERLVEDFRGTAPSTPTLLVTVSAVTLNRPTQDTELVCGVHRVDWREDVPTVEYAGVGDDPSRYRLRMDLGRATLEES